MSGKENRFERMSNGGPPMLRCWVNENSSAVLFPEEAHVIVEDMEGRTVMNIVPKRAIVSLGVSAKGDALGSYQDAYVRIDIIPISSPEENSYVVELSGSVQGSQIRMRVPMDQIVFAHLNDPVWEEIKRKLAKKEGEQETQLSSPSSQGNLVINLTDGSWERR